MTLHPCVAPDCSNLVAERQPCPVHGRKRGASGWAWQRVKQQVWKRDGGRCLLCGVVVSLGQSVCDHIRPVVQGGTDDPDNLRTLCIPCERRHGR
jgi:5-methylcytosine-specific restriction protein A